MSAPPSSSALMRSPVVARTTSGPVTNMWEAWRVAITKSVSAGEYTAPPAQGPKMTLIWGTRPEAAQVRLKIRP